MPDEPRIVGLLILIVVLGIVGVFVIVALLAVWRNYNRRDALLDEGRAMREAYRGGPRPDVDAWRASADRLDSDGNRKDDRDAPRDD